MPRVTLSEGDLFLVPVNEFYIPGIVTRVSDLKVPFGFFYNRKFNTPPAADEMEIAEYEVIYCGKFGIQGFKDGSWLIIGKQKDFNRKNWPLPIFYQKREPLPNQLVYLDDNLEEYKRENAPNPDKAYQHLPEIGLAGSEYIERKLAKLLSVR